LPPDAGIARLTSLKPDPARIKARAANCPEFAPADPIIVAAAPPRIAIPVNRAWNRRARRTFAD
jgi:hypothetical protein